MKAQLTKEDIQALLALIKATTTRMELMEKLLTENAPDKPSVVLGSFGE